MKEDIIKHISMSHALSYIYRRMREKIRQHEEEEEKIMAVADEKCGKNWRVSAVSDSAPR